MTPFCIRELAESAAGHLRLGRPLPPSGDREPIANIVADVRDVEPGDVWWALETAEHDRAALAEEAYGRGALGAVVQQRRIRPRPGRFSITVEDASWALWQTARAARQRFKGRVIAVSGGFGRHTARHLIGSVLGQSPARPEESRLDSRLAMPLALVRLDATLRGAAITCWSAKKGELQAISHLCQPEIAVINCLTNERPAELAGRVELIESELLRQVPAHGWVVLNGDDHRLRRLAQQTQAQVVLVGRGSHCDVIAHEVRSESDRLCFAVDQTRLCVPLPGRHHLHAALAAVAVGRIMDLSNEQIMQRLSNCGSLPGGGPCQRLADRTVLEPMAEDGIDATLAALETLREFEPAGRRVVVCREPNTDQADQEATRIGQALVTSCGADLVISCGTWGRRLIAAAREAGLPPHSTAWCRAERMLPPVVRKLTQPGDVVLVTGHDTAGMRNWIGALEHHARRAAA